MKRALPAFALALVLAAGVMVVAFGSEPEPVCCAPPPAENSARGKWLALAPATLKRTEVTAARIGRFVYVVGGFEERSGQTVAALERYDIRRNSWRRLRSMPIGVNHGVATAHRGKLYVHGGYTARRDLSSATRRLYSYTPQTNRWRRLPDSREPRAAHAFAALGGRLYAAGGRNETADLTSMEVYDVRRRRWQRGPSFPGPRRDHMTGVAAGGFFYALAGREGNTLYRTAERYHPGRRQWRRLPPMRRARAGIASAAVSRGRVVVFGGEDFGTGKTIEKVELFDPARRRWRSLPDMRTPRHGLGGVALGNRVYAIEGGPQPGFHFADTIEFLDVR
jgi:Kelch motif